MTEREKKFSEEITDFCVTAKVTSGLPDQSTQLPEVIGKVKQDYEMDDDEFDINVSTGLMPKAMLTKLKQYPAQLRNWIKKAGFPRIEEGRGIDYLLMVEDIPDAYLKEEEIKDQMREYVDATIPDWDAYKAKVIKALGNVDNPEQYFTYETKEDYLSEFHLKLHIDLVSNATMIPAGIVDEEVRRRIQEGIDYEAGFLITRLEEMLDEDLKMLHNRLLNTESALNTKTFNQIKSSMDKASKFSLGRSDSINRAVAGIEKVIQYLTAHPEKLAELGTRKSCEATFNKIYAVLSAEEMHVVQEYDAPSEQIEDDNQEQEQV